MQIAFLFANWISFHNAVFCKNVVLFLFHFLRHLYPRRQLSSYSCQNNWVSWFPPDPGAQLRGTVQNPPRLCSQFLETYSEYCACSSFWSIFSMSGLHPQLRPEVFLTSSSRTWMLILLSSSAKTTFPSPISHSISAPGTISFSPGLSLPGKKKSTVEGQS